MASNALKYNRAHGEVQVAVTFDPAQRTTRVEVRDSGIGLTPGLAVQTANRVVLYVGDDASFRACPACTC